ncbi:hypothetical protein sos41_34090 [Alphaproteobacteria bacterium SO-S41]|nr:hypothetical protein sos41_34090 [Alphaproteobacteria bacterium SO-S41]
MRMAKAKTPKTPPGFSEDAAPPPFPPARKPMAQLLYEESHPPRRAVNLTASSYWLHEAKTLGLNLSELFDRALEEKVREAQRAEAKREVAEYNEWHAKHLAEHGLWNEKFRRF